MSDLPRYRLLESAFVRPIGGPQAMRLNAGVEIALDGPPPVCAAPLNDAARAAYVAMLGTRNVSAGRRPHEKYSGKTATTIARALGHELNAYAAENFVAELLKQEPNR